MIGVEWAFLISGLGAGFVVGWYLGFNQRASEITVVHRGCAVVEKKTSARISAEIQRALKKHHRNL
jgi:hypothetical protein